MSIADQIAAAAAPKNPGCALCDALEAMPESDSSQVREALAGRLVSMRMIAKILTDNGFPISETTVGNHRRQEHT